MSPPAREVEDSELVYPNEPTLFWLSLGLSCVAWLALLLGTLGMALLYAPFIFILYLFSQSALIAYLKGTAVRITPQQYPDLHARLVACCERLGMARVPECYLLNGQGGFNAFATRFLGRDFVVLFSDVVDALEDRPGAVNFYLGHELAHIHRGHLKWGPVLLPAGVLPLLGAAYHRARESTCDRYGAACCADLHDAVAGLTALAAGEKRWKSISVDEYVAQAQESGGFWMSLHELVADYPWLVKRVARVVAIRGGPPSSLPSRNPLAYFFALFVPRTLAGGAGGLIGMLMVVAIILIIAAIAIPSLLRARIAANEAAAVGDIRALVSAEYTYVESYGRSATLACLAGSADCTDVPASVPLIDQRLATEVRQGYVFDLRVDGEGSSYVATAVPMAPGRTGIRSFCADESGVIYVSSDDRDLIDAQWMRCSPGLSPLSR